MDMSKGKLIGYISILLIICILTVRIADYIVRSSIDKKEIPIDTSTRM